MKTTSEMPDRLRCVINTPFDEGLHDHEQGLPW